VNKELSNAVRFLSVDMVDAAKSGHPGLPLGVADIATVLFSKFLKFSAKNPKWANRDRFILSAGHGSAMLYSLLHLSGYKEFTIKQLKNFRQKGSITAGHPESYLADGIETTTGPLGQGFANAVGMAIAERILNAKFGSELIDHKTYVICSDGDLMEGISHEAASLAGHLCLKNLVVLFDDNEISIDGKTSLSCSDNQVNRFKSYGWNAAKADGHNYDEIEAALKSAQNADKPTFIACKTTIGFGSPNKAGSSGIHGSPLGADENAATRKALNWNHAPFEIPENIKSQWEQFGSRHDDEYKKWAEKFEKSELSELLKGDMNWASTFAEIKDDSLAHGKPEATRASSGKVLAEIVDKHKLLIGGSADLSGSNCTLTDKHKVITKDDFDGNYIHYGVREHAMAAIMNGLTLSGFRAYGGTFLIFTDYARPSIRLSALMKLPVIYVMTHDSIGLGEDGPTHQPVEHLASLRAMPNLNVFRPADAVETAECWELALNNTETPTVLALSRQNLEQFRHNDISPEVNSCTKGAYLIKESENPFSVTIFASGSEVEIALETAKKLEAEGKGTKVVSVPSLDLFFEQDMEYQMLFTCNDSFKVAIEAGVSMGWGRLIGPHGLFCGLDTFGESAPYKEIYDHFGITPEQCSKRILHLLAD